LLERSKLVRFSLHVCFDNNNRSVADMLKKMNKLFDKFKNKRHEDDTEHSTRIKLLMFGYQNLRRTLNAMKQLNDDRWCVDLAYFRCVELVKKGSSNDNNDDSDELNQLVSQFAKDKWFWVRVFTDSKPSLTLESMCLDRLLAYVASC
jgi:hypothetical protein